METWKKLTRNNLGNPSNLAIYLIFLLVLWLSYYFKFNKFGLYEDDYWIAGISATSSFHDLLSFIKDNLLNLERNQGRYIAAFLPFIVAFINFKIGGITAIYIFGILLVGFNAFLIFKIIGKKYPVEIAFLTGLIFVLYPGDTTKAFIVHIYHLQISLLFTLLGMLLYVNDRKFFAYLMAFTSLMNYENAFLPFTMVPFLTRMKWDKILLKNLVKHFIIIGFFFVILYLIRRVVGENTITQLKLDELIRRTFISFIAGPLTAALSFVMAAYEALLKFKETYYIVLVVCLLLIIVGILYPALYKHSNGSAITSFTLRPGKSIPEEHMILLKAMAIGIIITIIGYSFAFPHYPPTTLKGRMTSVHFGATFGISLLVASMIRFLFILKIKIIWNRLLIGMVLLLLSLCAGYGVLIQNDFVKSWNTQKTFWTNVIKECPDITENTLILVKQVNVPETAYVVTYSWAYPLIFELLYDFPGTWERIPKLDILDTDFSDAIIYSNGNFIYKPKYPFLYDYQSEVNIEQNNLILLKLDDQKLSRLTDTLFFIGGAKLDLKEVATSFQYPKNELYDFIITE